MCFLCFYLCFNVLFYREVGRRGRERDQKILHKNSFFNSEERLRILDHCFSFVAINRYHSKVKCHGQGHRIDGNH